MFRFFLFFKCFSSFSCYVEQILSDTLLLPDMLDVSLAKYCIYIVFSLKKKSKLTWNFSWFYFYCNFKWFAFFLRRFFFLFLGRIICSIWKKFKFKLLFLTKKAVVKISKISNSKSPPWNFVKFREGFSS